MQLTMSVSNKQGKKALQCQCHYEITLLSNLVYHKVSLKIIILDAAVAITVTEVAAIKKVVYHTSQLQLITGISLCLLKYA